MQVCILTHIINIHQQVQYNLHLNYSKQRRRWCTRIFLKAQCDLPSDPCSKLKLIYTCFDLRAARDNRVKRHFFDAPRARNRVVQLLGVLRYLQRAITHSTVFQLISCIIERQERFRRNCECSRSKQSKSYVTLGKVEAIGLLGGFEKEAESHATV